MKKLIAMLIGFIIVISTRAQDLPDPLCLNCIDHNLKVDSADIYMFESKKWNKQCIFFIFTEAGNVPVGGTVDYTNVLMTQAQIDSTIATPGALQLGNCNFFMKIKDHNPVVIIVNEHGIIIDTVNAFSFMIHDVNFPSGMGRVSVPKKEKPGI